MEIIEKEIKELKPNEDNEYIHSESQIKSLSKIIEKFGFDVPIVIDEDSVILKGHARLEALQLLAEKDPKFSKVKCIVKRGLTKEEKIALRISDNRVPEFSKWDENSLVESFKKLGKELQEYTLFSENQIQGLIREQELSDEYNKIIDENQENKELFHSVEIVFSNAENKTKFLELSKKIKEDEGAIERGDGILSYIEKAEKHKTNSI